jgi:hypothetical protein
LPFLDAYSG